MDEDKVREVLIDPVNVNVTIKRRTDYVSITVIALIILGFAVWGILTRFGVLSSTSS